jgi:hypothetical protein
MKALGRNQGIKDLFEKPVKARFHTNAKDEP